MRYSRGKSANVQAFVDYDFSTDGLLLALRAEHPRDMRRYAITMSLVEDHPAVPGEVNNAGRLATPDGDEIVNVEDLLRSIVEAAFAHGIRPPGFESGHNGELAALKAQIANQQAVIDSLLRKIDDGARL